MIKDTISTDLCGISKKLNPFEDKGIFIIRLRRKQVFKHADFDDKHHKSGCSHCREYQETVSGFAEYFKVRNSMEKPVLDIFDLQLINKANIWTMDFIRSKNSPTPPLPEKSTKFSFFDFIRNQNPMKALDLVSVVEGKNSVRKKKSERCSKLEKNLQDTSLKLQNLHDNLESLRLESNMHFCKWIDFLNS